MLLETTLANGEEAAKEVLVFLRLLVKQMPLWKSPLWKAWSWDNSPCRWTLVLDPAFTFELLKWTSWIKTAIMRTIVHFSSHAACLLAGKWEWIITGGWKRHYQKTLAGWKHCCVPLPCGIRQGPCIRTIQNWHIQDMLTQRYSKVGKVAIMPTHW